MKDARPSGSRKRKSWAPNRSTPGPGPQPSTCIPAGHEQELQSKAVEGTIFVNVFPKAQRADEPSVLAESSPNLPSSERVRLSPSAIHSPKSLQQDSQNQTAGMELSKQHSSPVAHNGPTESPSERRRIVTIKVPQRNNGNAGSKDRIASQQEKAPPRTNELDTLSREPMKESTTDKLTGITTYGTTPGTGHTISSPPTSSHLGQKDAQICLGLQTISLFVTTSKGLEHMKITSNGPRFRRQQVAAHPIIRTTSPTNNVHRKVSSGMPNSL
ncbi:hypothetical protein FOPG_16058 [Fusarium oxysporum f. sp. conglutinans race 2 54008]|uniref:Uncharacterized protein n=1 Tax=Fusarium oxysporum f. sp. conglutinans race 2 54008 TaxID=1089457 RepID=X0H7J5_FUSOX|nr:hypothetical protein FOPG_16058 [Fusarium oxysporum f. sp. conglutinans race 2 54008]